MNTEPKPIYGEGNPETHPLTWRLSKQEHVGTGSDQCDVQFRGFRPQSKSLQHSRVAFYQSKSS